MPNDTTSLERQIAELTETIAQQEKKLHALRQGPEHHPTVQPDLHTTMVYILRVIRGKLQTWTESLLLDISSTPAHRILTGTDVVNN